MRKPVFTAFALAALASAAFAQDPGQDFTKADAALNATYRQVEHRLAGDAGAKARLITAQKGWIAFRDGECAFQSSGDDGGSAAPTILAACKASLTRTRTEQLKGYLHCAEGDLSCPVPAQ
ncbi:lysozyme inhibitor LprI family protein [Mesorhizobium sp. 1M-11]|uniref:lysozyme inhibitor LprI family protein n=1 Tax=Mesorhizobium sp. 1M-11 TaxID=1529006 RepID=UPI0006C76FA9|nr:lysozyme inhibitor LprI family protein [Mesorhizobium sp. 1M-11]